MKQLINTGIDIALALRNYTRAIIGDMLLRRQCVTLRIRN